METRVLDLGPTGKTLAYALLVVISLSMVLPFLWMISTSLKPPPEVIAWPPDLIPREPTWENYTGLFKAAAFQRFFLNSVIVSLLSTISIVFTSALAIFAFMQAWAAFIWPLLVVKQQEMYTMELGLGLFQNRFTIEFGLISAGSVVSFVPVVVVFLLFRRNIVRGITLTGLKGA
jgi:ABC-type glycerol-3-phosphate transport system permease component